MRLCLDRTVAPRRDRAVEVALPAIDSAADLLAAIKAIAGAVRGGTVSAAEALALALSQMLETFLRAIEASDFEMRLRYLEGMQAAELQDSPGVPTGYGRAPV
jgi:hypothetical protein